jgi:hypothetical protein
MTNLMNFAQTVSLRVLSKGLEVRKGSMLFGLGVRGYVDALFLLEGSV